MTGSHPARPGAPGRSLQSVLEGTQQPGPGSPGVGNLMVAPPAPYATVP